MLGKIQLGIVLMKYVVIYIPHAIHSQQFTSYSGLINSPESQDFIIAVMMTLEDALSTFWKDNEFKDEFALFHAI